MNTPKYRAPDMVAALDCGFKFYSTWDPCIPHLLPDNGAPCVFTEFTLQVYGKDYKLIYIFIIIMMCNIYYL